jgi:predicted transcriptional regulator
MRTGPTVQQMTAMTAADPERAAAALVSADAGIAARLAQYLERHLSAEPLDRFERVWQLSSSQAATVFGVSRQAYAKWRSGGIPAERRVDVQLADEATATLLAHVKIDRIPVVVRRPSPSLGGRSLLDVARANDLEAVRDEVEAVFDLRRVQP